MLLGSHVVTVQCHIVFIISLILKKGLLKKLVKNPVKTWKWGIHVRSRWHPRDGSFSDPCFSSCSVELCASMCPAFQEHKVCLAPISSARGLPSGEMGLSHQLAEI